MGLFDFGPAVFVAFALSGTLGLHLFWLRFRFYRRLRDAFVKFPTPEDGLPTPASPATYRYLCFQKEDASTALAVLVSLAVHGHLRFVIEAGIWRLEARRRPGLDRPLEERKFYSMLFRPFARRNRTELDGSSRVLRAFRWLDLSIERGYSNAAFGWLFVGIPILLSTGAVFAAGFHASGFLGGFLSLLILPIMVLNALILPSSVREFSLNNVVSIQALWLLFVSFVSGVGLYMDEIHSAWPIVIFAVVGGIWYITSLERKSARDINETFKPAEVVAQYRKNFGTRGDADATAENFERLLPWAVALEVADRRAASFEKNPRGLEAYAPGWFQWDESALNTPGELVRFLNRHCLPHIQEIRKLMSIHT